MTPYGPASSMGKRIGAAAIDFIGLWLVSIPIWLIVVAIDVASGMGTGSIGFGGGFGIGYVVGLVIYALMLAYFVLLEGTRGQTVGKMLLSMRVVKEDGTAMDMEAAFKRRFWFFIGFLIPFVGGLVSLGIIIWFLVTMSNDSVNRGFHDTFARTMVVDTR